LEPKGKPNYRYAAATTTIPLSPPALLENKLYVFLKTCWRRNLEQRKLNYTCSPPGPKKGHSWVGQKNGVGWGLFCKKFCLYSPFIQLHHQNAYNNLLFFLVINGLHDPKAKP